MDTYIVFMSFCNTHLPRAQECVNKNNKISKTYSIGYLTNKIWRNKIYSDDFDADFELLKNNQKKKF